MEESFTDSRGTGPGEDEDGRDCPTASPRPTQDDLVALGDEIAQLAGQIAAAEARFLTLLGEFDAWGGWGGPGIRSLAHWLSWRVGMSLRTAQEHIRMARALRRLPRISRAFGDGELSFSKVRALTRVAAPETEESLVSLARNAPAAHVERVVAGLRKVTPETPRPWDRDPEEPSTEGADGAGEAGAGEVVRDAETGGSGEDDADAGDEGVGEAGVGEAGAGDGDTAGASAAGQAEPVDVPSPPRQRLQWRWDEETDELVVWGRFGAADGKLVLAALTRAELERIRTHQHDEPGDGEPVGRRSAQEETVRSGEGVVPTTPGSSAPESAPHQGSRSDAVDRTAPPPSDAGPALVALAQIGVSALQAPAHAAAAEVVYLHQADPTGAAVTRAAQPPGAGQGSSTTVPGTTRADDGPVLDMASAGEVLCGAAARCVVQGAKGAVLAYGRRRRLFSATQLKALRLRDGCCQTPGCGRTRFLHAHHVVYWWHGGLTNLDNAVLLCSACHRSVHLGRLRITASGDQQFEFVDTGSGEVLDPAPPVVGRADRILAQRTIGPRTVTGGWFGEPLDLSAVTADLLAYWRQQATSAPAPLAGSTPSSARTAGGGSVVGGGPVGCGDEVPWDDPSRGTWEVVSDPEEAA